MDLVADIHVLRSLEKHREPRLARAAVLFFCVRNEVCSKALQLAGAG